MSIELGVGLTILGMVVGAVAVYFAGRMSDRKDNADGRTGLLVAVERLATLLERLERDLVDLRTANTKRDADFARVTDQYGAVVLRVDRVENDQRRLGSDVTGIGKRVERVENTAAAITDAALARIDRIVTGLSKGTA
jgi:hypothetical protein